MVDPAQNPAKSVAVLLLLVTSPALATEYYVAPSGSDSNPGTMAEPFATLQKGHDAAAAGDTVWLRDGTYPIVTPKNSGAGIVLSKSGTSDSSRINFFAYPGERPVLDFAGLVISTSGYTVGISVSGDYIHMKGLEIENVPMNTRSNTGITVSGSNDIFELLDIHHINGTGLFIHAGSSTGGNLVLNCDSHDNYDPTSSQGDGQNADGFGVHYQETGNETVIRGCRAWWNSDDGYDLISQEVPVIIENSWAMANGYINSGSGRPADGNGNGFKAGSSKTGIRHVVRNCLAWGNRASGFYANHSSGGNDWFNNTSYQNGTQYNMLASTWDAGGNRTDGVTLTGALAHKLRNNIGFPNKNSYIDGYGVDTGFNSWDLGITPGDQDFKSVSDSGAMGPRAADGSLPNLEFMKLSADSSFLDRGTDVGLPFAGSAPDLGCFETGLAGGGASGAGGEGGAGMSGGGGTAGDVGTGGASSTTGGVGGGGGGTGAVGAGPTGGAAASGGTTMGGGAPSAGAGGTSPSGGAVASGGTTTSAGAPSAGASGTGPSGGSGPGGPPGVGGGAAGSSSPADDGVGAPSEPQGCACRASRRGSGAPGALLAALALALFGVRRRGG